MRSKLKRYLGPHRNIPKKLQTPGLFMPFGSGHDFAMKAEECKHSFRHFIREYWEIIDPGHPYIDCPHIHCIADHLQAVTEGQIQRLAVTVPPGHAKSLVVSVLWPAWEWTFAPVLQSMFFSYDPELATRDASRNRIVIESDKYKEMFNIDWSIRPDQNEKKLFVNTKMGFRYSFGLFSEKIIGRRGDKVVIDDPLAIKHQFNSVRKMECINILNGTLGSRVNDKEKDKFVIIMQRLAENDLVGYVKSLGDWEILTLATEYDPAKKYFSSIGWTDWRKDKGELLFPEKFSGTVVDRIKTKELTQNEFSAQHQQEPVIEEGARFRREFFGSWEYTDQTCQFIRLTNALTGKVDIYTCGLLTFFVSVDVAVGEKRVNDFTVYLLWGKLNDGRLILMERHKERMTEPKSVEYARSLFRTFRRGKNTILYFAVESNGVGQPLIQNLNSGDYRVDQPSIPTIAINVHTDKMTMSLPAVLKYSSGQIHHPVRASWLLDYEKNLLNFPLDLHDDDVTAVSIGAQSVGYGFGDIESNDNPLGAKKKTVDRLGRSTESNLDDEIQESFARRRR